MQKNNQQVTIVHIFSPHPSPTPLGEGGVQSSSLTNNNNIVNLIENNAVFLAQHNVEYIILDNLNQLDSSSNSDYLLKNISQLPSFRNNKLIYVKKEFVNLKQSFLTGVEIANNPNIFFVQNDTTINMNNVFEIEKSAPFLQKNNQTLETLVPLNNLEFFQNNVPPNFKFENFKLYMKKEKNILDKIRLFFI